MLKSFQRNKYTDLDRRAPGPPRVESKVHVVELEEVDKLKALGVQSFKKRDFEQAIVHFRGALKLLLPPERGRKLDSDLLPTYVALRNNCAMAHLQLKQYGNVVAHVDAVLAVEPQNLKAIFRRGQGRMGLHQWAGAEADLRVIIDAQRQPASAKATSTLADLVRLRAEAEESAVTQNVGVGEAEGTSGGKSEGRDDTTTKGEDASASPAEEMEITQGGGGSTSKDNMETEAVPVPADGKDEVLGGGSGNDQATAIVTDRTHKPQATQQEVDHSVGLLMRRFPKMAEPRAQTLLVEATQLLRDAQQDEAVRELQQDGTFTFMRTQQALSLLADVQLAPLLEARVPGASADCFGVTGLVVALAGAIIEGGLCGGGEREGAGNKAENSAHVLVRHALGSECDFLLKRLQHTQEHPERVADCDSTQVRNGYTRGTANNQANVAHSVATFYREPVECADDASTREKTHRVSFQVEETPRKGDYVHALHMRTVLEGMHLSKRVQRYRGSGSVSSSDALRKICQEVLASAREELQRVCASEDAEAVAAAIAKYEDLPAPALRDVMREAGERFSTLVRQAAEAKKARVLAQRVAERERSQLLSNITIKARVAMHIGQHIKARDAFAEAVQLAKPEEQEGLLTDLQAAELAVAADEVTAAAREAKRVADRLEEQRMRDMLENTRIGLQNARKSIQGTLSEASRVASMSV